MDHKMVKMGVERVRSLYLAEYVQFLEESCFCPK